MAKTKTSLVKRGQAKQKNSMSAKKKDLTADSMPPPEELTMFLRSEELFEAVLNAAQDDARAVLVRRYVYLAPSFICLGLLHTN